MAISGKVEADFSSYVDEVHKSVAASKEFERSEHGRGAGVDAMVASADKLEAPGSQLRIVKRRGGDEGALKETAESFAGVGLASPAAAPELVNFGKAIGETGHVLDLFDVKVGETSTLRKGLVGLGRLMEENSEEFAALGAAAEVAIAAIGGWEVGKTVGELTGLTDEVSKLEFHLLGLKTDAEQAGAATAKAIADAQKQYPGLPISDMGNVVALRQAEADAKIAANKARFDPENIAKVDEEIKRVNDDLQKIRDNGVEQDLIRQINSHAVSLSDLAKAYNISIEAMQQFSTEAGKQAAVEASNAKKLDDLALQLQHADEDRRAKAAADEDARLKAEGEQIDADTKAAQARQNNLYSELVAQEQARKATEAETQALNDQAAAANAAARSVSFTYDLSTAAGLAQFKAMNPSAAVNARPDYFKTHSIADAVVAGLISGGGFSKAGASGFTPDRSAPAPTSPTSPPMPGPTAPMTPAPGVQIHASVYVSGVFDPSSAAALGNTVSRAIEQSLTNTRVLV
jgi:hypothetical protein